MLYQEQAIKCFIEIAGFTDVEGEEARKAIGKKLVDKMKALKDRFVNGGIKNGYTKEDLITLFDQIELFSGYSFCMAHACAYSYLTAYCAWLSYYYPLEFFGAALTIDSGNTDDIRRYIKAIKERNLTLLPPNINKSDDSFIISNDAIIFGLNAIKGVGAAVSKKIIKNRPKSGYKSLGHFIQRNRDIVNSKVLESYAKAGVFSEFGNKESILQAIRAMLDYNSIIKDIGTYTIFDLCKLDYSEFIDNCIIRYIDKEDNPAYEIDSLGLYINKHPMEDYIIDKERCLDIKHINGLDEGSIVTVVGALSCIEIKKTKAKLNMANFNIDNEDSTCKAICFPKSYMKVGGILEEGKLVVATGRMNGNNEIMISDITNDLTRYAYKLLKKRSVQEFILNSKVKFILEK